MNMNITLTDGRTMDYSFFVAALFKPLPTLQDELNHAAMGVAGEAGEFVDAIKRHTIYGKEIDITNVQEEIGDALFYLQATVNKLGLVWEDIIHQNVTKLEARYPAGTYSDADAIARADKVPVPVEVPEGWQGSVAQTFQD